MKKKISIRIRPVEKLTPAELDQMWKLYAPHHLITKDFFIERTIKNMDQMALFSDRRLKVLVGIHGIRITTYREPGMKKMITIYYGQSYTDREYRGNSVIHLVSVILFLKTRIMHPFSDIYFWCDATTYKPYLIMANNVKRYYPSVFFETPLRIQKLLDFLGLKYYGEDYDRERGTVTKKERRLKEHEVPITKKDMANSPHIKFFAQRNKGHKKGDGMLCITPATLENFIFFLKKNAAVKKSKKHKITGIK